MNLRKPNLSRPTLRFCLSLFVFALVTTHAVTQEISFVKKSNEIVVQIDKRPVASYFYYDASAIAESKTKRPFLAHLKTPSGIQSSRNHPPTKTDDQDHATMHPGIWLAFGDINGNDFWRNKSSVVHKTFLTAPTVKDTRGTFAVKNDYVSPQSKVICSETCQLTFDSLPNGMLICWDSQFTSKTPFYFGDQEEMGLGMRLATELAEKNGGSMIDSNGQKSAKQIWGKTARWIDYYGTIQKKTIGQMLIVHPENFRPSWLHARNYGFVAANPFGRKAFGKGNTSQVSITPGKKFRLRYGIFVHSGPAKELPDFEVIYKKYLEVAKSKPLAK